MKDFSEALKSLAGESDRGEKVKTAIERAAKLAGLSYWRAFDIWYGKARKIEINEQEAIVKALDKKRREAARNELHDLKLRIAAMESRLNQADSEFYFTTIDALRASLRPAG